jgi:hypothetical protein
MRATKSVRCPHCQRIHEADACFLDLLLEVMQEARLLHFATPYTKEGSLDASPSE